MDLVTIPLDRIVDLATQVATTGAVRAMELVADDVFEMTIGIAIVIHSALQ